MGHWKKKKKRMSSGMNTPARGHGPSIRLKKGICMPNFPVQAAAAADADGAGVEVSWNQSIEPLAGSSIIKNRDKCGLTYELTTRCRLRIDRAMISGRFFHSSFIVSTSLFFSRP